MRKETKQPLELKLQTSIDRMQANNDEITLLLQSICEKLGGIIGYKHKEKSYYRVLVSTGEKEYDLYDLIDQTEKHIQKLESKK